METPSHAVLRDHLARLFPDHRIVAIEPLAPDSGASAGATAKAEGYGRPVRVTLARGERERVEVVWRLAAANEFGHDRRADRAANQLLAFDDFAKIPDHVEALDVGVIRPDGTMTSIGDGEIYLITTYAPGSVYAAHLRRIAVEGAGDADLAQAATLARYLAKLHVPIDDPPRYRRAIRDLVGHGEGIFGMIDGFPDGVVPRERLYAIERRCVDWRRGLRDREHRLVRTHGDFHPFNLVIDGDRVTLLDASRGCCGDGADDVTALAINYLLFALATPGSWRSFGALWRRFWDVYQRERPDPELFDVAPPYLAWRTLVVCNPRFYPHLPPAGREALLGLAELALATRRFEPDWADELFP